MSDRRLLIPTRLTAAAEAGPEPGAQLYALGGESMGTRWNVKLAASASLSGPALQQALCAELQAELDRVVAQMSPWQTDSDLSRYNAAVAGTWQSLPADFLAVMQEALQVAQASAGAFDPSAGALVDCWGFGPAAPRTRPPGGDEIAAALASVGWQRLRLDGARLLQPGGARLDLSAIAKGYGVDLLARWLDGHGFQHYLAEVGGELRGQGCKPDGSPWWVALESPMAAGTVAGPELWLALDGLAVASSGDYRRYFEHGGQRYAHTLDPRSGWPLPPPLAAVSVLHASCMSADAWSTALAVLGPETGLALAAERGLAARFLLRRADGGYEEQLSPALRALLDEADA